MIPLTSAVLNLANFTIAEYTNNIDNDEDNSEDGKNITIFDPFPNNKCVRSEDLVNISQLSRLILFWILIFVNVLSLFGNFAAIYSATRRKFRVIQKTCIISLALSDLVTTVFMGMNHISSLAQELLIWDLGEFLCHLIPMAQLAGTILSSVALTFIALDRYRNVVHALGKKWDPSLRSCLSTTIAIWIISFAVSYPMYIYFNYAYVGVLYTKKSENSDILIIDKVFPAYICITFVKDQLRVYYVIMVVLIFMPNVITFLWFYYKIAEIVWKHRKPVSVTFSKKQKKENSENESSTTNTKTTESSESLDNKSSQLKPTRDVRVERKIRTFKIIIALMSIFIICRFPYYYVQLHKIIMPNESAGELLWTLNYVFIAMNILNCLLNPLLYTFLNTTLKFLGKVKKVINWFVREICCCFCFNAEFEEFEKENPFAIENNKEHQNTLKSVRSSRVKFVENVEEFQGMDSRQGTLKQKY